MPILLHNRYPFYTLLLLFCSLATNAHDHITISSINYPPFVSDNHTHGLGYGLGRDIVTESFTSVGHEVKFDIIPMSRNTWSIKTNRNRATLGVSRWFDNEKNRHLVDSVDIFDMRFVFFYKKQRFPNGLTYEQLSELESYYVGNVRGSVTTALVSEAQLNVTYVKEVFQNFQMLDAGRIDLAIAVDLAGWQILHDYYPERIQEFATVDKEILTEPLSLIFRKEDLEIKTIFINGLKEAKKSGAFLACIKRYSETFGVDITENMLLRYYALFEQHVNEDVP
ncbi:transporter substrate-binding domain-containing protein [Vibrio sp. DW001]|uniref:substrate-binding periplasmic protein n=1 Tax=Vibrio sp. DW001 TaxID=2912315 RepID=UPI0023AEBBEF|nr:transporter substrate-binding domain-containing protein [Vibrio sp. DW001]WED25376.1 transporter substrate-binding domain-containing protein [Vibrio sp. DW001]